MYYRKCSRNVHYLIMAIPIILLKTKSQPKDPYEEQFFSNSYPYRDGFLPVPFDPLFVPVLQHQHVNLDRLQQAVITIDVAIDRGDTSTSNPDGLIITSQRAAEALGVVLARLKSNKEHLKTVTEFVERTKVYVVGPATFNAITALGFADENVLGKDCGNGDALAQFILNEYEHQAKAEKRRPLLFLVGDNHRDIIPKTLTGAPELQRVDVDELVIYETTVVQDFREKFRAVIGKEMPESAKSQPAGRIRWIVVFSPTGADIALEELRDRANLDENGWETLIACIGPTTQRHLETKLGKKPDAIAAKPSPAALWDAMTLCMKEKLEIDAGVV